MTLRIIFAGTPEFAATSLQAIIDHKASLDAEVVAVYTQPDRKSGRGQKITPSAVKQLALAHDIPVEQPLTFKKSQADGLQARATLKTYEADVMVVAAYGLILPMEVLQTPKMGCINIHASLLPRWRGAAPIHRAILAGDTQSGITIMQMDKGLDTGDMLYKTNCDITNADTSSSLHDKLACQGGEAIVQVLADLPSFQKQAKKQDENHVTYAEKLAKAEGEINWQHSAQQISTHIRGLQPWPVAYTKMADKTIRIHQAQLVDATVNADKAGEVIELSKAGILVQCGEGVLLLTSVQWPGGKALTAEQIYNGNKISVGDVLGE